MKKTFSRAPVLLVAALLVASTAVLPAYVALTPTASTPSTSTCNHNASPSSSSKGITAVGVEGVQSASLDSTVLNLTSYFHLSDINIPYKVVSASPLTNAIITFQLPATYHSRYFSIVWDGSSATGFLFNDSRSFAVFSHSRYLGEYQTTHTAMMGNYSITTVTAASMYVTPVPGGYNDPTIIGEQWVTFNNNLGQEIGYVIAEGTFNYILGGDVTGVSPQGSAAYAYNGYSICSNSRDVGGAGTTIGYVQQNAEGIFCLIFASDWWAAWPGMALNSLTGQLTFNSSPYWNTGTSPGCGCGVSFPPPPT